MILIAEPFRCFLKYKGVQIRIGSVPLNYGATHSKYLVSTSLYADLISKTNPHQRFAKTPTTMSTVCTI